MIKTWQISHKPNVSVQFSTRAFAFGYSHEWGSILFVFLGCFSIVWLHGTNAPEI